MIRYLAAIITGAALSALVVGLIGSLQPAAGFPHLTRNPWADYLALGGAADVSAMAVYWITAFCMTLCLFVAGLLRMRRDARMLRRQTRRAAVEDPDPEEASWVPS